MCAFHGDPQTAYRNSRDIFSREETYDFVFRDVTPEHAYLLHTLSSAIDERKLYLKARISSEEATQSERVQYQILQFSPSKHFLLYVLGAVAEQILNRRISNLKTWKVKKANISKNTRRIINAWRNVLEVILPNLEAIMGKVANLIYEIQRTNPKSKEKPDPKSKEIAEKLSTLLSSLESVYAPKFKDIRTITMN